MRIPIQVRRHLYIETTARITKKISYYSPRWLIRFFSTWLLIGWRFAAAQSESRFEISCSLTWVFNWNVSVIQAPVMPHRHHFDIDQRIVFPWSLTSSVSLKTSRRTYTSMIYYTQKSSLTQTEETTSQWRFQHAVTALLSRHEWDFIVTKFFVA